MSLSSAGMMLFTAGTCTSSYPFFMALHDLSGRSHFLFDMVLAPSRKARESKSSSIGPSFFLSSMSIMSSSSPDALDPIRAPAVPPSLDLTDSATPFIRSRDQSPAVPAEECKSAQTRFPSPLPSWRKTASTSSLSASFLERLRVTQPQILTRLLRTSLMESNKSKPNRTRRRFSHSRKSCPARGSKRARTSSAALAQALASPSNPTESCLCR
mmetsp:Transcript_7976/g.22254  ORF Transcript_7976/g.22254 Transcript_7976/m.22254 type:complete len:213 (-) Transcript_7976:1295-1933(-)